VRALRVQGEEIPEHVMIFEIGLRVPLLCVNEIGELQWVTNEEDGGVIPDHVPVTIFGIEFDCEASWITLCIGAALLSTHSRETGEHGSSLADLV